MSMQQRHLPNIPKVLSMLEWAGLGFGSEESFRLSTSMKNLAMATEANNLRFWGKILCRNGDLYVAEGDV